jgi:uncharacterized YigZ family protein
MTADDAYLTVNGLSEGCFSAKRSRFLAFAMPVRTAEEVKCLVQDYRRRYYDARHVCWAYCLGADRRTFRVYDDGEPSSTAGKPILGQIYSRELTDVLIIVVRYFGGIELGTGGLTLAYRTAAAAALAAADITERTLDDLLTVAFPYPSLNRIMRIVKEEQPEIVSRSFETTCELTLRIRKSLSDRLRRRLLGIETATLKEHPPQ